MKIAFNLRLLRKNALTGIGFFNLQTAGRIAVAHPEHTFYFIFDQPADFHFSDNVIPVIVSPKSRARAPLLWLWFEILLSWKLKRIKPDLLVAMDSLLPLSSKIPALLVIHDLNFVHYPHFMPKGISKFYRKYTPLYVQKAMRIAAVSESTKKDLINTYQVNDQKIDIVYSASNIHIGPLSDQERKQTQAQFTDHCPYFIFVGSIHPRKNVANQLMAFDLFKQKHPELNHKFVLVGDRWLWSKEEQGLFESLSSKQEILFLGRVSEEILKALIASAEALMYVSIFEGFGVPILEGFACEVPVITSTTSSMPEIAQEAALCVNPLKPEEIAKAMETLILDNGLRNRLIKRGKERCKDFSWDKTAQLLWESIEKTMKDPVSLFIAGAFPKKTRP